jgi:hypothetical protein
MTEKDAPVDAELAALIERHGLEAVQAALGRLGSMRKTVQAGVAQLVGKEAAEKQSEPLKILGGFWYGKISPRDDFAVHAATDPNLVAAMKDIAARMGSEVFRNRNSSLVLMHRAAPSAPLTAMVAKGDAATDSAGRQMLQIQAIQLTPETKQEQVLLAMMDASYEMEPSKPNDMFLPGKKLPYPENVRQAVTANMDKIPETKRPRVLNRIMAQVFAGQPAIVDDPSEILVFCASPLSRFVQWTGALMGHRMGRLEESFEGSSVVLEGKSDFSDKSPAWPLAQTVEKTFGDKDARFEVLCDALPEMAARRQVVEAFCTKQWATLTPAIALAVRWIEAVGTGDDVKAAQTAMGIA